MYLPPSKHFLNKMYKNFDTNLIAHYWLMHDVFFDPKFYFDSNNDLHEFYDESDHVGLKNHFISSGWEEGRFPFKVSVDKFFYIETYPDVKNYAGSSEEHFLAHGYKEGRLPYIHNNLKLDSYNKQLTFLDPGSKIIENKKEMYHHYALVGYHLLIK
tara:strand:- start:5723 stop:6193 length:471 start_codon:yes stop_codon:yes gene_type:complete